MSPVTRVVSENNSGVFNYFVSAYEQSKSHVYTSAVSASLFGVLKFLEVSKNLEITTSNLETATCNNGSVLLSGLEGKIKEKVLLKSVEALLNVSKQLEVFTSEIEILTNKTEHFKMHENIHKIAVLSSHWGLLKLSQISRNVELLTNDFEALTHAIANPPSQQQESLATNKHAADVRINQISLILCLRAVETFLHVSKRFENAIASVEINTDVKYENKIFEREKNWIKHAVVLLVQKNVLKLLELSKITENVIEGLEVSSRILMESRLQADLIEKTVNYFRCHTKQSQIIAYNAAVSSLLSVIASLHRTSKQLEYVTTALDQATIYKAPQTQNVSLMEEHCIFRNDQISLQKLRGPTFISSHFNKSSTIIRKATLTATLSGINIFLHVSKKLEKISREGELFTSEVFGYKTETEAHSRLLLAYAQILRYSQIVFVAQSLRLVSQAHNASRHLEIVTRAAEASTLKMCEAGFERRFLRRIKNSVYITVISYNLAILTRLTWLLQKINSNVAKKKLRRDKNCNDDDFEGVGRSYKMMNASKDLERLLNELEAFVIELPDVQQERPSQLSKLKEEILEGVAASQKSTASFLRTISLLTALSLSRVSRILTNYTGNLEIITERFEQTLSNFYSKILLLAAWNVKRFAGALKFVQPITSDLELFTHEICYPSLHRKKISVCSQVLNETEKKLRELLVSLGQKPRIVLLFATNVSQKFVVMSKESVAQIKQMYPKLVYFSQNAVEILLILSQETGKLIRDLEQHLSKLKNVAIEKLDGSFHPSRISAIYDYGRNRIVVLSTWCAQIRNYLEQFEKIAKFEVLNEIDRFQWEFAKSLQCRLINPSFTFEFQMQVTSCVTCYKTNRQIRDTLI